MKIKRKCIDENGIGYIVLIPEEREDMWHAYNLICVGDVVKASTFRRIARETATGSKDTAERRKIQLKLKIEKIDFTPEDGELRLTGMNIEENQWVKNGAYHTLVLEVNRQFTLEKPQWDAVALERIEEACNVSQRAEVCAVMVSEGVCNMVSLTESMMVTTAQIQVAIPKKRELSQKHHDSSMQKFFDQIYETVLRVINFEIVKCVIIAGPGFTKDQLLAHLIKTAERKANDSDGKKLMENKKKFIVCTASSPHKYSLKEVLQDKLVLEHMSDTKAAREVNALEKFFETLQNDADRATYGYNQVVKAHAQLAIHTLMISDSLFRAQDIRTRAKYVGLVQQVKDNGGAVLIFSSLHVSGNQLDSLTGVAAILRFPLPDLDIESEEEEPELPEAKEEKERVIIGEDDSLEEIPQNLNRLDQQRDEDDGDSEASSVRTNDAAIAKTPKSTSSTTTATSTAKKENANNNAPSFSQPNNTNANVNNTNNNTGTKKPVNPSYTAKTNSNDGNKTNNNAKNTNTNSNANAKNNNANVKNANKGVFKPNPNANNNNNKK